MTLIIHNLSQTYIDESKKNGNDTFKCITKKEVTIVLHSIVKLENLKKYEVHLKSITCPISHEIPEKPILLNNQIYDEDAILKWLKIKEVDPATNLPINKSDLIKKLPHNIKYRLQHKNLYQYNMEIYEVVVCKETQKIIFKIKNTNSNEDTNEFIKINFNQIKRYKLYGFIYNHSGLQINIDSKISKEPVYLNIMASNLSTTLFKIFNDIFNFSDK